MSAPVIFPIATGILGLILLAVLFARIRQVGQPLRLKKHRSTDEGLMDLINWASVVDEGVIVCKNGAFLAGWIYRGEDNASATDEQRNAVSQRINQALTPLGTGWVLHVDAIRKNAPVGIDPALNHFTDPVCEAMDEERRAYFTRLGAMYEGCFVITLTWFPPILAQQKFVALMFDDESVDPDETSQTLDLIDRFKKECRSIEARLSMALKLERLRGQEIIFDDGSVTIHDKLLQHLQFCLTGLDHPVALPKNPIYIDALVGCKEMWGGVIPKIGRHYILCVAIEGFPLESHPGILASLSELSVEYRWSTRFIFLDRHEALAQLDKYRKKWRQKIRGFLDQVFNIGSGALNHDAVLMMEDAESAKAEVSSGSVSAGYYTSVVVLMDEDRAILEESAQRVEKAVNTLGFTARVETINTLDAFMGSLPGHAVENVRRPLVDTMNLADLLPTSTIWTGEHKAPCPMYPPLSPPLMQCATTGHTPFWLNLHVRDLGHTIIFGPTGAGKSTLIGILAAQLRRYAGMSIFAFDKGQSLYPLVDAAGGNHYTLGSDEEELSFCPLSFLESRADRAWALEWLDTILGLSNPNGFGTTPGQRNEIASTLENMHETGARTLSDFVASIQDTEIREALKQYTVEGTMGHLLDAGEDGLAMADFMVFEIEELMGLGERFALPVLLYLFRRIEKSLHGQPAAIILDEAWLMLGHPVFREKIREWLKVMRKANCIVVMATQSLSDASRSGILDVIVESTATKIFLPNVYARDEDTAALYTRMGLNRRQIEILAAAIPKRDYYFVSERGRRLFELALGPLALSFVGATDKESLAKIKQLKARFGPDWPREWLKLRNIDPALLEGKNANP